jgi:cytochrome P450
MYAFFLFMILHPEIQAKAQAEIDEMIGSDRPSYLSDHKSLPYVKATVKEVLRCGSIIPGGFAHKLIKDDVYGEYFIPEGALITPNIC